MNFKIFKYISLFVLAIGLSACHDGDLPGANKEDGGLGLVHLKSLTVDLTNAEHIMNNNVGSRSGRSGIDMANFQVEIWDENEKELVNEWSYEDMPEIFELEVGEYKAVVYNKVIADADFDTPYFYGESPFTITLNHVTDIDKVICKLANIKVSIRYENNLYNLLEDDAKVTVSCGGSSLIFNKEETRSGYFKANSDNLLVRFEGRINGELETNFLHIPNVAPGQHRIITYSVKNPPVGPGSETGFVDPNGISIDTSVEDEDLTTTVNNSEDPIPNPEDPGKEDPKDDPGKPDDPPTPPAENTIEITAVEPLSFDKDISVEALIKESASAIVNITAEKGITNFVVSIATSSAVFESIFSSVIPFEFDLAYPDKKVVNGVVVGDYGDGEYKDVTKTYTGFGFPVGADVKGATHLEFNITEFLEPLSSFNGSHRFTLIVTDSTGNKSKKTLTLTVTEGSM